MADDDFETNLEWPDGVVEASDSVGPSATNRPDHGGPRPPAVREPMMLAPAVSEAALAGASERLDELRAAMQAEFSSVRVELGQLRRTVADTALSARTTVQDTELDDLRREVTALRTVLQEWGTGEVLSTFRQEMSVVRDELTALRRRIAVRTKSEPVLDKVQLEQLVEAIAARLAEPQSRRRR